MPDRVIAIPPLGEARAMSIVEQILDVMFAHQIAAERYQQRVNYARAQSVAGPAVIRSNSPDDP
ncbi:hypothetical protein DIE16_23380 [Burkholderia sp. Bp9090]|nr:hypothetical protein DIE16_23380 [Burkholderia sp. Bp9090]